MLSSRAGRLVDLATVTHLQEELFTTLGRSDRAIEVCLDYLRDIGVQWLAHPTQEEVQQEYERLRRLIGPRSIEELVDLPPMTDPKWRATMDVLTAVVSSALFTDKNLLCLVICRMANLSLEHGNCDGSCFAYVWLGMILGPHFGDYRAGFCFGKLGLDLVEQRGLRRYEARVYLIFGHRVIPWTQPIRNGRSLVRRAFDVANKLGDLTFAAYSCDNRITNLLASGDPLAEVALEAEAGLDFARHSRFGLVIDRITTQLRLIRTLRGLTPEFGSFNDTEFDEVRFEQHLTEEPDLAIAACWYWIRKLQARFFAGEYASAMAAAVNAERLLWTSPSFFELAEYHLYAALTRAAASASIINYVVRTHETLILDDAQNPASADSYISQQKARSILCLPLINQAKLAGVLYLENKLTPNVFTPARTSVLKLLASQATISLENTRLYHDLELREAKIRRLFDANIMGVIIFTLGGKIIEANEAFLRMVGYSREDLVSGQVQWMDLTPVEWRGPSERALAELAASGIFQPFEKEYFRKDGSRVPVMIGGAMFEGSHDEGVAFVLDLSGQKHAEEALQKAQTELAHASRVMTMGELTASIAHEVSQPLAAMSTNASASLRWLAGDSPNLAEAREAVRRILRDGNRASGVIARMRALFKKAPAAKEPVDINEIIQEVLAITQVELQRNRVSLRTECAEDLPMVIGDKIQLQQVILNLVVNAIEAMSGVSEGSRELCVSSQRVSGIPGEAGTNAVEGHTLTASASASVLVGIRDSGPGLDATQWRRVFETYYTTKSQGMGMGLAISRSIIQAHGGRLWATANAPRGALFQFTLPLRVESTE